MTTLLIFECLVACVPFSILPPKALYSIFPFQSSKDSFSVQVGQVVAKCFLASRYWIKTVHQKAQGAWFPLVQFDYHSSTNLYHVQNTHQVGFSSCWDGEEFVFRFKPFQYCARGSVPMFHFNVSLCWQVQTRSADEPMTTSVYCNNCGNRWKVRVSCDAFIQYLFGLFSKSLVDLKRQEQGQHTVHVYNSCTHNHCI